jgi:hypothetical protein
VLYWENDFKDLIKNLPDIYIKVMDNKGRVLFKSERAVFWRSDRLEYFEIEIR